MTRPVEPIRFVADPDGYPSVIVEPTTIYVGDKLIVSLRTTEDGIEVAGVGVVRAEPYEPLPDGA